MNFKKLLGICLMLFVVLSGFSQKTIHVEGTKILSACNEEIIMRGVNEMFIWSPTDKTGETTLPEIAKTGANTVRLVWTTDGKPADLEKLIENCLAENMIPVAELHDATGDFTQFQKLLDYWKLPAVLEIIQKHKEWLIVNIGNEVGSGETNDQWEAYYKDGITQLRDAGIDAPLMIDCGDYGSNEQYFLTKGESLMQHDPMHNLIFSVHTYWVDPNSDQGRKDRLDDMISEAATKKLPFIIGEGPQMAASPWSVYCEVDFPYVYLLKRCEEEGIGWLSWSWGIVDNNDCGAPNSVFDITTDGLFGNWATDFAEEIMITDANSVKNTSVIPVSLSIGNCGVACAPVSLASNGNMICADGSVTLTATVDNSTSKTVAWFLDNEVLVGESSLSLTTTVGGNIRVEIDSAQACVVFDEIQLIDKVEAKIEGETEICALPTTQLTVVQEGALATRWLMNNKEIVEWANAESVDAAKAGLYKVEVYSDYCSGNDEVEVFSSLPDINDTTICKDKNTSLNIKGNVSGVWFSDEGLTDELYVGSEYIVNQSESKTYYVQDQGGFSGRVGKEEPGQSVWDTWDEPSKEHKLGFEVFETLTVKSMDVYAKTAGALNVVFFDSEKVEIEAMQFTASAGKNVLDINKEFTAGVYYASVKGSAVDVQLNHDEGNYTTAYPYDLMKGSQKLLSIDRTDETWIATKPWYLYFYNWEVTQSSGGSCAATKVVVDVNENCLVGINDTELNKVSVYPNPFNDMVKISVAGDWELLDISGKVLLKGSGDQVSTGELVSGTYLLQVNGVTYRLVK